jgi:chemotaxis protein MotC
VVLGRKLIDEAETTLAQAALAYAQGNRNVAVRLLDKVDVYALPPSLAGHVALVKAIVIANADLTRVIRLCDEARLLSPGTLVEETALRLAIEATLSQGDKAKFETMAHRYFRRFPRSPYLTSVIPPVANAIAQGGYLGEPVGARWVQLVVQFLEPSRLLAFYSALAEAGVRSSKLATTLHAARMAQKYSRKGSSDEAWAMAFEGSSMIVGSNAAEGLDRLAAAEAIGSSSSMLELIARARAVAKFIQAPPPAVASRETSDVPAAAPPPHAGRRAVYQSDAADPARLQVATSAPAQVWDGSAPDSKQVVARIAQVDKLLEELGE